MILLIDNYDSFVYNLYQLIGSITPDLKVIRNDACTVEEIEAMHPESIVISPGPGRPEDAGNILEVIRHFTGKTPILGVCLGHQAICKALGGVVTYAKELMHGKHPKYTQKQTAPCFAVWNPRSGWPGIILWLPRKRNCPARSALQPVRWTGK